MYIKTFYKAAIDITTYCTLLSVSYVADNYSFVTMIFALQGNKLASFVCLFMHAEAIEGYNNKCYI